MAARELFIWYRVQRECADEARAAVLDLQRSLRDEWPGLNARLLVREDEETSTWMETYSFPAPGGRNIDAAMQAAIAAAARPLQGLIDGSRHVEDFTVVS